jgi:ABC-type Fe3+ transport system substrate-binding protein
LAKQFIELVMSPEGQKILKKYGFKTSKELEKAEKEVIRK